MGLLAFNVPDQQKSSGAFLQPFSDKKVSLFSIADSDGHLPKTKKRGTLDGEKQRLTVMTLDFVMISSVIGRRLSRPLNERVNRTGLQRLSIV